MQPPYVRSFRNTVSKFPGFTSAQPNLAEVQVDPRSLLPCVLDGSRRFFLALAAAFVLIWTVSGCGGVVVNSDTKTLQLTLSSASVDFGSVTLNTISTKSVTISSDGTATVTINAVTVTGTGFTVAGVSLPATLAPGQTLNLQVAFEPTLNGLVTGSIVISSDSSTTSTSKVTLAGKGVPLPTPQLTASANTLDFGSVTVNTLSAQTLTLTSSGNTALTVDSVALTSAAFAISGGTFPATLNPGQSLALQVSFDPTATGAATGTLTITSDSSTGATSAVSLIGMGTASQLTLSTSSLDFGNVNLNTTSTKTLTLTSSANAAVTVNSIALTGTGFAISGGAFPATLNPGQTLALQVSFDPTSTGAAAGTITISSNATSGSTSMVSLNGTGMAAQLTLSGAALDFGNIALNTNSTNTLILTSSGNAPITVNSAALTGSAFAISGAILPATLNPGEFLTLQVSFDPIATGPASGTITVSYNSLSGGTATVNLTGTGTAAQLTVSSSTLNFGNLNLNTSSTRTLTLTSSGNAALTVNSVTVTGAAFAISGATFPTTLTPGQSLVLQVSFDPTTTGAANGTITISSNSSSNSIWTVSLSGAGIASQLNVSSATLDFGDVDVNTSSTQTLNLTSSGTAPLTVNSVTLTGTGFAISGTTFPVTLNPGQSLALQVSFNPAVTGTAAGTITISTDASSVNANKVTLSGRGVAAQLTMSSSSLDFGNVNLNATASKTLTLTSSGNSAVTVNSVTLSGAPFAISGATFPTTLNPGQSLSLQVSFNPTATGAATGNITLASSAFTGGTSSVALTGTGTAAQLTISSATLDFGNINLNTTSTKTLTLTSSGNAAVTVNSVTLSGAPFAISGVTFPTTLNPGQSLSLQVSFNPTVTGAATGTITLASSAFTGGTSSVALMGTGTAAQLTISSATLDFGNINLNTTSTKTLTLTSSGNAAVTVNSVTLAGTAFTVSGGTYPATLNPGQSLSLQVSFNPTVTGAATGTITLASSAFTGGTSAVALTGTGTAAQLTISSATLAFGNINLNTTSTKTLTLTSSGNTAVTVNSVTLAGASFTLSGGAYPLTLNPGQSLSLQVSFSPTVTGAATGTITIASSAFTGGTSAVALTGTGTAVQLTISSATLAFGNINLNTTSTKTLTLTSSGNAAVTVNSVTLAGAAFTISGGAYPLTLNPGQSLSLQVSFNPTVIGAATGTITISSNATSGGTSTVTLTGAGTNPVNPVLTLSTATLSFGSIQVGTPITLSMTLSSTGTSPVTVSSAAITGAGFAFSGATFPVTLNPTIAITIQVQFDPTAAGTASGSLTFTSNSTSGATSVVSLSGTGTPVQHQVSLNWTAPLNSPVLVTGYDIYRAIGASSSFQLINSSDTTDYIDFQVSSGTSYTYYVTSTDGIGTQSTPSNQVTVTVP